MDKSLDMAINYDYLLEIDTTPAATEPKWEKLCAGFNNLAPALNEVLFQTTWLCSKGWGSTEVTGGQYIITLTGQRVFGDAAQDFIFSKEVMYAFGSARKTKFRISDPNGDKILWNITLATITEGGGDSNQPNAITVTIHGNGAPIFEAATP